MEKNNEDEFARNVSLFRPCRLLQQVTSLRINVASLVPKLMQSEMRLLGHCCFSRLLQYVVGFAVCGFLRTTVRFGTT